MYLVTGFPKQLTRRLAQVILDSAPEAEVALLAQEHHEAQAAEFVKTLPEGRAKVLVGEISSLHLGLATAEYRELCERCTDIVHAAEWSVGAERTLFERVNVDGARAVVDLAQDCDKLRRLTHFSTVFVSGDRVGVVAEDELSQGQSFRNLYEQTRFEAELVVRNAMARLPCTVLRPSIVVGGRVEGPYAVAILLVTSPLSLPLPLPGDGVAPFNVVPLEFVAAAAHHLHHDPRAVGRTFHLVDPSPSSSRRVYELVAQKQGRKLERSSFSYKLTDALMKLPGLERLTREQRMAVAYVNHLAFYSSRATLELLEGTQVRCPPVDSYLDGLIESVREAGRTS